MLLSRGSNFASSKSLSCKRRLLARFSTLWNGNGGLNRRSVRRRTREQAVNVNPAENSFLSVSITTLSTLWLVTAQASLSGSCRHEHEPPSVNQVRRSGVMVTLSSESVGPL